MIENNSEKSSTKWQDVPNDGSIDNFAKLTNLNSQFLRLAEPGVIILPNNAKLTKPPKDKNLFTRTTKNVLAAFEDGGMQVHLYDDGKEKYELILDYADVILPILFFLEDATVSVGLGILANWISLQLTKTKNRQQPSMKVEYAEIAQPGTIIRWRRIEGPATEVQKLLLEESRMLAKKDSAIETEPSKRVSQEVSEKSRRDCYYKNSAGAALEVAKTLVQEAEENIDKKKTDIAESLFRRSLVKIREAVLLEPEEPTHNKYLHEIGHRIHDIFGCHLEFKDGQYWMTCPVKLSHNKGGFSTGGSGKAICSICGINIFDCPHVNGRTYDGVVASHRHDICNICGKSECEHEEGKTYNEVQPFAIIVEIDVDHVSLVSNPANPLCVATGFSLSKSELLEIIPENEKGKFIYGETILYCNHCLTCKKT